MNYRILVLREPEDPTQDAVTDPIYEDVFDANEDMADEIGTQAGLCIEEAIVCDVAALQEGKS